MGGAVSAGENNEELVENLVDSEYIRTSSAEAAFRAVDRGNYYLAGMKSQAYRDTAWKHGNLHLSAPCIYAEVVENLCLKPGLSFLNLGSGTGYLNTVAGLLLGMTGVNHGIELHEEVITYAEEKLSEFFQCSPAIDMMNFCPPKFVKGNAFLLDSAITEAYDRVYCGAAVSPEFMPFVKNLVKVGGIIVMPCGDTLIKVERTSLTSVDTTNVLPVSFASFVEPTLDERKDASFLALPTREPMTLQELCRGCIRDSLRQSLKCEHCELIPESLVAEKLAAATDENGRKGSLPQRNRGEGRRVRRIVIPVIEPELEEGQGGGENDDEGEGPRRGRRIRHRIVAIGTADLARSSSDGRMHMQDVRWNEVIFGEDDAENGEEGEHEANSVRDDQNASQTEPDLEDQKAGSCPLSESSEAIKSAEVDRGGASDSPIPSDAPDEDMPPRRKWSCAEYYSLPSDAEELPANVVWVNRPRGSTDPTSSECSEKRLNDRKRSLGARPGCSEEEGTGKLPNEGLEPDEDREGTKRAKPRQDYDQLAKSFSKLMKDRIQCLTLPDKLKDYVNLNRDW